LRSLLLTARSGLRLDARVRAHAIRALGWLTVTRIALAVLPYATVRRSVTQIGPRKSKQPGMSVHECARAIDRATRVLSASRCLARGVAAECLLRREGRHSTLNFGVHFDDSRRLQAHAWLESEGVVVTGAEEAARYASLEARRTP
jgi:transglutaminase superfamily protein